MAEGEAGDPAPDPQDADRLITDFAGRVPGVLRAAVAASDGFLVALSDRTQPDQLYHLSAITAGFVILPIPSPRISAHGALPHTPVPLAPIPPLTTAPD